MPSKRKRPDLDKSVEDSEVSNNDPLKLDSVENYPRKRISVACNLCRFRKTKCDAVRPTCGFCANLGVECHYRDSALSDGQGTDSPEVRENAATSESLSSIETRLKQLESRVGSFETRTQIAVASPESLATVSQTSPLPLSAHQYPFGSPAALRPTRRDSSVSNSTRPLTGYVYRQTRAESYTARPSLLYFRSPPYLKAVESWEDSAEFYDSEIATGDYFNQQLALYLTRFPDVSRRTVRILQQSFVENFLGWMPIFEPAVAYSIVNDVCAKNFPSADANSCLAMFMLAVGSISQNHGDLRPEPIPGIDYFSHACHYLNSLSFLMGNLTVLHCRILQAAYFKLAIRPLLSWNCLTQGARDCMHALNSRRWQALPSSSREPWHRAFWACSIMMDELEASMKTHTIGHRTLHDVVPLPRFENEDTGFYYFLAQISLRKLVMEALDVVGYRAGKVNYVPVVTAELRNQAQEWHSHLPAAIRFPADDTPQFDARKSFLRMQYFSICIVLEWASVLRVMEVYGTDQDVSDEIILAKSEAQICYRYCALYINVAEEQLLGWKLGTFISIWTLFVYLATLIITHNNPALSFIPETQDEALIRSAYEMLSLWDHIPFVRRGINRMSGMMERIGLSAEPPTSGR